MINNIFNKLEFPNYFSPYSSLNFYNNKFKYLIIYKINNSFRIYHEYIEDELDINI